MRYIGTQWSITDNQVSLIAENEENIQVKHPSPVAVEQTITRSNGETDTEIP